MQLIYLVRKLLIMASKLGAYLKLKRPCTGTTGHTDLLNPNADLNPNSNLAGNRHEMKTNAWAVWGPLRLGGPGPGPSGPIG